MAQHLKGCQTDALRNLLRLAILFLRFSAVAALKIIDNNIASREATPQIT